MTYCDTVKYADGTVIYYSHADYKEIEDKINIDLNRISTFFDDNELIINLKKGKSAINRAVSIKYKLSLEGYSRPHTNDKYKFLPLFFGRFWPKDQH